MFIRYLFSSINRYFSKVFLFWIFIVTTVALFIVSLVEFAEYSRRLIKATNVSFSDVAALVVLKYPQHIQVILPFVIFIAAIITFSKLNRTSEITVVRNLGIAIRQIIAGFSLVIVSIFIILISAINPISSILIQKHEEMEASQFLLLEKVLKLLVNMFLKRPLLFKKF